MRDRTESQAAGRGRGHDQSSGRVLPSASLRHRLHCHFLEGDHSNGVVIGFKWIRCQTGQSSCGQRCVVRTQPVVGAGSERELSIWTTDVSAPLVTHIPLAARYNASLRSSPLIGWVSFEDFVKWPTCDHKTLHTPAARFHIATALFGTRCKNNSVWQRNSKVKRYLKNIWISKYRSCIYRALTVKPVTVEVAFTCSWKHSHSHELISHHSWTISTGALFGSVSRKDT